MKVLITGGAGFIGSHLVEAYLKKGVEVYVIDNLSTGRLSNVEHLKENKNFHFIIDTVLNYASMSKLVADCNLIIHLAAAVGVSYIIENPLGSMETNIRGTEIALSLASKFNKKIIIASSSEVYGKHTHSPLREDDNIVYGPPTIWRWSYASSKLMDEYMSLAYYRTKKLPVVIVRLFNTIGPRQVGHYGMVVPRFIKQALMDESITVYSDGKQTRTFTYVGDVVEAIIKLAQSKMAEGQIVNIGGNKEIAIKDLAQDIIKKVGSKSKIEYIPYSKVYPKDFEDMKRRVPSLEKLKRLIGYIPATNLDIALEETIDYFRREEIFL
jgi:UDP-glucose 4-epimerase